MVLMTVKPEWVNLFQEHGDEDGLRSARDIVSWILQHHRVRIADESRRTDRQSGQRGSRSALSRAAHLV
jgi:hypothetical protein